MTTFLSFHKCSTAISITLSAVSTLANLFVMVAFSRCSRICSPSNKLLLFLSLSDLSTSLLIPTLTFLPSTNNACSFTSSALSASQTSSLFFITAIAIDKVVSLAKPLHYSEIITHTSLYIFALATISFSFTISSLSISANDNMSNNGTSCLALVFRESTLHSSLDISIALCCSLALVPCYLYVYRVASRHARDIKLVEKVVRNKEIGDFKHSHLAVAESLPPPSPGNRSSVRGSGPRSSFTTFTATKVTKRNTKTNYGFTLTFTVALFFSRVPISFLSLMFTVNAIALTPLLINCILDPWVYPYHNMDLKPIMRRLLRQCLPKCFFHQSTKRERKAISVWEQFLLVGPVLSALIRVGARENAPKPTRTRSRSHQDFERTSKNDVTMGIERELYDEGFCEEKTNLSGVDGRVKKKVKVKYSGEKVKVKCQKTENGREKDDLAIVVISTKVPIITIWLENDDDENNAATFV